MSRIALVKPEKARAVEDMVLRAAQTGQLTQKVDEAKLITLLEQLTEKQAKPTKITVGHPLCCVHTAQIQRRRYSDEED